MSIAIFLPTRKGSLRVQNKNTKQFAGFEGGLLELKLRQLSKLNVDEVILSTNDESSIEIGNRFKKEFLNLKIDVRPEHLALSTTSLTDLISYVPTITKCEHILWTHVTSPMVNDLIYADIIEQYYCSLSQRSDSLMTVSSFKNFLWSKEKNDLINRVGNKRWPQTQDLMELYEINSAVFITSRLIYKNNNDRIGQSPFLYKLDKITSIDVDWNDDFKLAEIVYEKFYKE